MNLKSKACRLICSERSRAQRTRCRLTGWHYEGCAEWRLLWADLEREAWQRKAKDTKPGGRTNDNMANK